jgi:hypothetical protein
VKNPKNPINPTARLDQTRASSWHGTSGDPGH